MSFGNTQNCLYENKKRPPRMRRSLLFGDPKENRTPDSALRGQRLKPLDHRAGFLQPERRKKNDIIGR